MFIQTEETPNPNALKFLPGQPVGPKAARTFSHPVSANDGPFLNAVFAISGVESVFLAEDFLTITKAEDASWSSIKGQALALIADYCVLGRPLWQDTCIASAVRDTPENEDPIARQIRELIETRVRPAVAMDGGEITFESFENGIVNVHLRGSCAGCPSSSITLKSGIESMLRHYVPEVIEVRAVQASVS